MPAIPRPVHPTPRSTVELAAELLLEHRGPEATITGVSLHAALVQPGDLFVALPGATRHGIDFWPEARDAGATALMTDAEGVDKLGEGTAVIVVDSPRALLGRVSQWVYGTGDREDFRIFAVTGTNGKTSTAFLLDALMRALGWTTALSTTAERAVAGVPYISTLTTPEAPDIHAMVALAREKGATGLAIEVSAQALDKNRLDQIVADVAGFTNLSHDHFEDFGGMDAYLAAKAVLFTPARARRAVVCIDTSWGEKVAEQTPLPVWTVGGPGTSAKEGVPHWIWTDLSSTGDTTAFTLRGPEGESLRVMVPVIGEHMVANAALAVVMMVSGGVSLAELGLALGEKPVPVFLPGRLERVSGSRGPDVYVDAGRSEDAYLATLRTLRARTAGRVIMVCGTSGNRDASKRPLMGRAAATGADVVIVTDDDPRHEDPSIIRAGLLEGAHSVPGAEVHEIPDPTAAITFAVSLASPGDCVVWCGPGSQAYRDISGTKVPYSARDEARVALAGAGWSDD